MNPYLKQYQKNEVETASPEKILIMLYEGAIQYLNVARIEMTSEKPVKDIGKIHTNIVGAQNIITEFQETINFEIGGEFANKLYSLYSYMYQKLVDANIKKDVQSLDEVLKHLRSLRDAWKQAIEKEQKKLNSNLYDDEEDDEEEKSLKSEVRG